MRKLKMAFVLPMFQVVLAAILLRWAGPADFYVPTSKLICWGLNAPALLFRVQAGWGPISAWVPGSILGVDTSDLFFLVGVTVVWYLVGRALDRRGVPQTEGRHAMVVNVAAHCCLLMLGGFLFYAGLQDFWNPNYGGFGIRPERGILMFLWSGSLIFLSGRTLVQATRRLRASA